MSMRWRFNCVPQMKTTTRTCSNYGSILRNNKWKAISHCLGNVDMFAMCLQTSGELVSTYVHNLNVHKCSCCVSTVHLKRIILMDIVGINYHVCRCITASVKIHTLPEISRS